MWPVAQLQAAQVVRIMARHCARATHQRQLAYADAVRLELKLVQLSYTLGIRRAAIGSFAMVAKRAHRYDISWDGLHMRHIRFSVSIR